jgi:hypothetical protein
MNKVKLSILFLFLAAYSFAQEKNEVERRVKKSEVAEAAKDWLKDAYENKRKTKWYFQTDGDKEVFEAKLKHRKHLHSVEFNLEGNVQNIEVLIKEKELDPEVYQNLIDDLNRNFNKFSISKLQIQYTGEPDDLEDLIDEDEFENITIHYEIEFYGKSDTEDELWEGLFDSKGKLLEKRIVKLKATDNLDY